MDITLTLLALPFLLPLLIGVSILLYVRLGSPIFFTQIRPGLHGKPMKLIKFRSMLEKKDEHGQDLADADRLTGFGQFLRRASLDELPELWLVLKGDMSLVGPRPLLMEYLPLYNETQRKRHQVRPGLTGWAQVNGRNNLSWAAKFELDVWYVEHQSVWLDIKIIALTLLQVVRGKDVSQQGHVTAERFTGDN